MNDDDEGMTAFLVFGEQAQTQEELELREEQDELDNEISRQEN